jgi:hypothetical protein
METSPFSDNRPSKEETPPGLSKFRAPTSLLGEPGT